MNQSYERIRTIARRSRRAIERLADFELNNDLIECNDADCLAGYCARASGLTSVLLSEAGIKHKIVYGDGHVYVLCDKYIIDTTATQFSHYFPMVMVCTYASLCRLCILHGRTSDLIFWNEYERMEFGSLNRFIDWQMDHTWPLEQSVQYSDVAFIGKQK